MFKGDLSQIKNTITSKSKTSSTPKTTTPVKQEVQASIMTEKVSHLAEKASNKTENKPMEVKTRSQVKETKVSPAKKEAQKPPPKMVPVKKEAEIKAKALPKKEVAKASTKQEEKIALSNKRSNAKEETTATKSKKLKK